MSAERLDILAIAAHPGDAEACCGGTLIRMASQGYRTGVLDLTVRDVHGAGVEAAAGGPLGLGWRDNQRMPAGRLDNTLPARMTLALRIRELRPRVVILPFGDEGDPDEVHGRALGVEACSLAGRADLEEYSAPHRPERILYASFFAAVAPAFVVDISGQFEARMAALRESTSAARFADPERVETLARYHGSRIGVRYGEPFVTREPLALGDIVGI